MSSMEYNCCIVSEKVHADPRAPSPGPLPGPGSWSPSAVSWCASELTAFPPGSVSVSRRSWGQQPPEPLEQKPWPPSKDSLPGSKSSDSGEEAEKEFIFV